MSHTAEPISIYPEPTPNPMTMKLVTDRVLLEKGSMDFPTAESAEKSPLADKLFQIPGVTAIFIGRHFVTLTKNPLGGWNNIIESAIDGLRLHLEQNLPILGEHVEVEEHDESETITRIREILDKEIRPAVAMDGGDITFVDYKDHVVQLRMKGSCAGCPSSTMTLKMGIERRLQEEIPEIEAVESVY